MRTCSAIKVLLTLILMLASALSITAQTCDPSGDCGGDTTLSGNYDVVAPIGKSSVEMIEMAPRLETLDGKTIALVGMN